MCLFFSQVSLLARPVEAFTKEGCCGHLLLAVAVGEIWSLHPLRTQPGSSNMTFRVYGLLPKSIYLSVCLSFCLPMQMIEN